MKWLILSIIFNIGGLKSQNILKYQSLKDNTLDSLILTNEFILKLDSSFYLSEDEFKYCLLNNEVIILSKVLKCGEAKIWICRQRSWFQLSKKQLWDLKKGKVEI